MDSPLPTSSVWRSIDFRPAIVEHTPDLLLPYLAPSQRALDLGCNTGKSALWLARQGVSVLGIDINPEALDTARHDAEREGLQSLARFQPADITSDPLSGTFDILLLIRTLTCIPTTDAWNAVLQRISTLLTAGGLLYVHDFVRDDKLPHYRQRYRDGELLGWRPGSFAVNDAQGHLLFVAHHHTPAELDEITNPYERLALDYHLSQSLNGNQCRMFRFLGRRR